MVTKVGMQSDFFDALRDLGQLDVDAAQAYQVALAKLDDKKYSESINKFKEDHDHHVEEITKFLTKNNQKGPDFGGDMKSLLTKGKVTLANLMGDGAILRALLSNEEDTNTAYERMNSREDIPEDAVNMLQRGLEDEKRHKAWFQSKIEEG